MREKRLMKYYQNGNDAFRLKKYTKNLLEPAEEISES